MGGQNGRGRDEGWLFDTPAPHHPSSLSLLPPALSKNRNQLLPAGGHAFTRAASQAFVGLTLLIRPPCTVVQAISPTPEGATRGQKIFTHMLTRQGLRLYKPLAATMVGQSVK